MKKRKITIPRTSLGFIRIRAVRLRKSGVQINDIAKLFDVNRETVSRWLSSYRQGGARALKGKKSSGRPRKIDCLKFFPNLKKIIKKPATSFGFDSPLWTCQKIRKAILSEFRLKISKSTVWRALHEMELSCQKPERRAFEQDPIARKKWLKEEWPRLKSKAKRQHAVILFEDESSVALNPSIGRTWSRVGQTPIVYTTGNRGSISVMSAISPTGKLYFKLPQGNVNSDEFIDFIKQLLREVTRKKVILVVDKGTTHTSKRSRDFIASIERLEVVYLPSYSPDFNPDEYTWEYLKTAKMKTHVAQTKMDLRHKTLGVMRSIQKKRSLIKSFYKRAYVT